MHLKSREACTHLKMLTRFRVTGLPHPARYVNVPCRLACRIWAAFRTNYHACLTTTITRKTASGIMSERTPVSSCVASPMGRGSLARRDKAPHMHTRTHINTCDTHASAWHRDVCIYTPDDIQTRICTHADTDAVDAED